MSNEQQNEAPVIIRDRREQMPCAAHERRIALTEQAVMSLVETNQGITTKLDLLLAQMTKVALLEERNINQQQELGRVQAKIEANGLALEALSLETRAFMNNAQGRDRVLWSLSGVVGLLLIKVLFFSASLGMTP